MNRGLVLALGAFFALVLLSGFVTSQDLSEIQDSTDSLKEDADKVINATDKIREFTEENKWEYLGEQWKEIILRNPVMDSVHEFLGNFNFVFVFLFGEDYDFSLTLFFAIALWFFFFAIFYKITSNFSSFGDTISIIVSIILAIVFAHLRVYEFLSILIFKLIFFKEGIWGLVSFAGFILIYLFVLIYLEQIIWKVGRAFKKSKEEKEKWDEKFERIVFKKRVEGIEKAFEEVSKEL